MGLDIIPPRSYVPAAIDLNPTASFSLDEDIPHFSTLELPSQSLSRFRVVVGLTAILVPEVACERPVCSSPEGSLAEDEPHGIAANSVSGSEATGQGRRG
jgi:hypothetical protein